MRGCNPCPVRCPPTPHHNHFVLKRLCARLGARIALLGPSNIAPALRCTETLVHSTGQQSHSGSYSRSIHGLSIACTKQHPTHVARPIHCLPVARAKKHQIQKARPIHCIAFALSSITPRWLDQSIACRARPGRWRDLSSTPPERVKNRQKNGR